MYSIWEHKENFRSPSFKAKVALEALKERETLAELSVKFGVAQEMISRRKSEFVKNLSQLFNKRGKQSDEPSKEIKLLRSKVGELTMERDFLADACKDSKRRIRISIFIKKFRYSKN